MVYELQVGSVYLMASGQYVIVLFYDADKVRFEVLSPPQPDTKGARGVVSGKGNFFAPGDRKTVSRAGFIRSLRAAGNMTLKDRRRSEQARKAQSAEADKDGAP